MNNDQPREPSQGSTREPPATTSRHSTRAVRAFAISLLSLAGIVALLYLDELIGEHSSSPLAGDSLSYGLLFVAGLFTGFHCVGMCGALVLSYTVKAAKQTGPLYATHLYYAFGKTLSYTVIGALFGALGAVVSFTPFMRGVAGMLAGAFLLLFGLGLLKVFPSLGRFQLRPPGFLMRFIGVGVRKHSHPFVIGLLNGLMIICGPLQAMYVMAAGTGSPAEGACMLFVFGLGTLPVMMGFGALASTLSANVAPKLVRASGFIVMALGVIMLNRGLSMSGIGYDFRSVTTYLSHSVTRTAASLVGYQTIRMQVTAGGYEPDSFALEKGIPVRWIIEGKELNYCNHRIVVPAMGMEFDVQKGENVIEFTPGQVGVIPWSCWMGMISGNFLVHEKPAGEGATMGTGGLHSWRHGLEVWIKDWSERVERYLEH